MTARDLLTALQSADIGTPELSARVVCALLAPEGATIEMPKHRDWYIYKREDAAGNRWAFYIPPEVRDCTKSLDAAVALIERVLGPSGLYRVEKLGPNAAAIHGKPYWATAGLASEQEDAFANTAPLALISALIASKTEEER